MRTFLHGIHQWLVKIKKTSMWKRQVGESRVRISDGVEAFAGDGRILVIAPHADDELIGCHQLIRNHSNQIKVFYCGLLGSNYSETNRIVRQKEFEGYANFMRVESIISSRETLRTDMAATINNYKPHYVFLPSVIDWQQEHRHVNYVLEEILGDAKTVVCWYHVSLPIPGEYVNTYSLMDGKKHKQKWTAMNTHYTSQLHMDIDRFKFVEQMMGEKRYYYETYFTQDLCKWKDAVSKSRQKIEQLDALRTTLGHMGKMLIETESLYKEII